MNTNKISKKILIVEDDEDFVFILEKKFTMEGFLVVTAKDGQEGAAVAEKEKPDLILSDILMPNVDGMAMAKKIREFNERHADVSPPPAPIYALCCSRRRTV